MSIPVENLRWLLDGDVVVYRSAGAAKEDEPVENALHNAKVVIERLREKFPGAPSGTTYLTGKGNFRDTVATIQGYKANRDRTKRPKYYQDVRDYLTDIHKAVMIDGREADDAMGCEQWKHRDKSTVIVTNDKDLDMIPGWHYNWTKDKLYYVTLEDANRFFYHQLLTGDRTDNIRGIAGCGPATAAKLLKDCGNTWDNYAGVVRNQYQSSYGDTWEAALIETAKLLWIWRTEDGEISLPLLS